VVKKRNDKRYFEFFLCVQPPKRKDKKMISFMQSRVDNIMSNIAKEIQKAIGEEESFLKSNEKDSFDKAIFETKECEKNKKRYENICKTIENAKKTFWKLHKIVKSYGFATKDGFKEYIGTPNE